MILFNIVAFLFRKDVGLDLFFPKGLIDSMKVRLVLRFSVVTIVDWMAFPKLKLKLSTVC